MLCLVRRRDNGVSFVKNGFEFDNRWVVPYNPFLSFVFNCHINVEVVSSVKAVKYLYKYIAKGPDRVVYTVAADNPAGAPGAVAPAAVGNATHDEINEYQTGR